MTKNQALRAFKQGFGTALNFKRLLEQDYIMVKTEWDCFTDTLCKDGEITEKQYNTWLFPFKRK